jgi:hypothetical protein
MANIEVLSLAIKVTIKLRLVGLSKNQNQLDFEIDFAAINLLAYTISDKLKYCVNKEIGPGEKVVAGSKKCSWAIVI